MKKSLFGIVLILPLAALARDARLTLEPIYGIETNLVRYPESKSVTRAVYGARAVYGTMPLSGELEFSQAHSREDYSNPDTEVEDTSRRLALGLRSTYALGKFVGFYVRAGGRASEGESKITSAGVTETKEHARRVDPYAGTGLQIALGPFLAVNGGVTLTRNFEGEYDPQYTLGLSARFGNF